MLADHVKEAPKAEMKISKDLSVLNDRLDGMETDCKNFMKEFEVIVGKGELGGPAQPKQFSSMKDDIVGIRQLLNKNSISHKEKIETVRNNVMEVKAKKMDSANPQSLQVIAKQTDLLEETAAVRGKQMSWMFFVLIGCVLIIGFLMYNRMNYYEKK